MGKTLLSPTQKYQHYMKVLADPEEIYKHGYWVDIVINLVHAGLSFALYCIQEEKLCGFYSFTKIAEFYMKIDEMFV